MLSAALACAVVDAQAQTRRFQGSLSGVVYDSLAKGALGGAIVQVVPDDSAGSFRASMTSDSAGRFSIADVPAGRYLVGFLHPLIDSLGIEPPLKSVQVASQNVAVALATPSAGTMRAAVCGRAARDGALTGTVRTARSGQPVKDAMVDIYWVDMVLTGGQAVPQRRLKQARTESDGTFAVCGLPSPGAVSIVASGGGDSTEALEVDIPASGFLRAELGVTSRADSTITRRLRGVVVDAASGRPISGAILRVGPAAHARTGETGEFTLEAPVGTHMLDVRGISYYPARRIVNVTDDMAPMRIALTTFKVVLDAVTVTAMSGRGGLAGFAERKRSSGTGRFLTAADIARVPVTETSEIFKNEPGVSLSPDRITLRSPFGECAPQLFVNGHYIPGMGDPPVMSRNDLDMVARPQDIIAIEIYKDMAPPQFSRGLSGCGSIVIWTR